MYATIPPPAPKAPATITATISQDGDGMSRPRRVLDEKSLGPQPHTAGRKHAHRTGLGELRSGVTDPPDRLPESLCGLECRDDLRCVLLDALDQAKIPNISLRVGVPHYLMHAQHPKSAAALLQHLQHVLGIPTDHANLQQEISRWQELHDAAVEGDPQASAYVQMLEHRHDQLVEKNMPTGDDLAAELEEFLRNQSDDE